MYSLVSSDECSLGSLGSLRKGIDLSLVGLQQCPEASELLFLGQLPEACQHHCNELQSSAHY